MYVGNSLCGELADRNEPRYLK